MWPRGSKLPCNFSPKDGSAAAKSGNSGKFQLAPKDLLSRLTLKSGGPGSGPDFELGQIGGNLMTRHGDVLRIVTAMAACGLVACASGGGTSRNVANPGTGPVFGSVSGSGSTAPNQAAGGFLQSLGQHPSYKDGFGTFSGTVTDEGIVSPSGVISFTFTPPVHATTGSNSAPSPAVGRPLDGTEFPLQQTVIAASPYGIVPDTAANNGGATLSIVDWSAKQFRLSIPSLDVNTTFTSGTLFQGPTLVTIGDMRLAVSNMDYTVFGAWEVDRPVPNSGVPGDYIIHLGAFVTGYETPSSAMPSSGTANYSGTRNVAGIIVEHPYSDGVYYGGLERASVQGDASFTANFATGSVTGSFTHMIAVAGGSSTPFELPWNDISVNASIAAGTSHFSGTTAAAPVSGTSPHPWNAFVVVSGSAKGKIDGGFYGPQAEELGAVWSVSDGPITAIGVVGAH
jgi:hypothetical protein